MSRAKLTQFLDVKESQDDLGKTCLDGLEYTNKMRRNPNKQARKEYFAK